MAANYKSAASNNQKKVLYSEFYSKSTSYNGHPINDLELILPILRNFNNTENLNKNSIIFLAGDSTLDNKYWITEKFRHDVAIGPYAQLLEPPKMVQDVSYHLNNLGISKNIYTLNTAVEASTLEERLTSKNLKDPRDLFIQKNLTENDILVVSVGGNDIALKPTFKTIMAISSLVYLNSFEKLKFNPKSCVGINHLIQFFRDGLKKYVQNLIKLKKPKQLIICMLYFMDEASDGSWADKTLAYLKYNKNPEILQQVTRAIYDLAIKEIRIDGCEVQTLPLFEYLDGKDPKDYVSRVEPSAQGGLKIAKAIFDLLKV
ncbi:hypothetical protein HDU92_005683 [Lobulomyces angularis]|nr:hypothetical protein HDU92_005683 [Lobulomyces angularis]